MLNVFDDYLDEVCKAIHESGIVRVEFYLVMTSNPPVLWLERCIDLPDVRMIGGVVTPKVAEIVTS
jgi:hypothetical protein